MGIFFGKFLLNSRKILAKVENRTNLLSTIYLAHTQSAESDSAATPYKVVNVTIIALYGITAGSLPAGYSGARYSKLSLNRCNITIHY